MTRTTACRSRSALKANAVRYPPWLAAVLCFAVMLGCERRPAELTLSGPTMGTTYTVKLAAPSAELDPSAMRAEIEAVLARVDASMSGYRADSEVARFNASRSTDWFAVSGDLARIVLLALQISEATEGAFDITVAPLVDAWGFGPGGEPVSLPDAGQLQAARTRVGYSKLHVRLDPAALRKDEAQLAIDLNGIAPGFAVDLIAQRLDAAGVHHFMIELGGEVRVRGLNGRGEPWRVAVEQPIQSAQLPYAILQLGEAAVATSGEYRHAFVRDGRSYSHTIDPATGRPVGHGLGSVAVIATDAAHADAWATALNVLGPKRGYALAARHSIAAMFIEKHGEQWLARMTPGFGPHVLWRAGE